MTSAPPRAAATAAERPAEPPPTTSTSGRATTGTRASGRITWSAGNGGASGPDRGAAYTGAAEGAMEAEVFDEAELTARLAAPLELAQRLPLVCYRAEHEDADYGVKRSV